MKWLVVASVALVGILMFGSGNLFGTGIVRIAPNAGTAEVSPDLVRSGQVVPAAEVCSNTALCPSTLRAAYSFSSLSGNSSRNGTGQSVVIVDACGDSSISTDLHTFDVANGLSDPTLQVIKPQGTPCANSGWSLETALDVEWSHVIAPGATIKLVESKNATFASLFGAWNYSIKHALGNQISNSWGGAAACSSTASSLAAKAATKKITILASAGDSGAWGSGQTLKAASPADCTGVLTVGGTSLHLTSSGAYSSESAWSGSGGGYAPRIAEPTYQVTANISDPYGKLGKPDVAADADPNTGVWVYNAANFGWLVVGGTSVACPIWAGFVADANSWRAFNTYSALGNFAPYLYLQVYGANGTGLHYGTSFHDVTSGSNGWSAGVGWDAATGLGSFRAGSLASLLGSDPSA